MNLAEISLQRKTSTFVLTILLFLGGAVSFFGLGKLEDPEFTIKEALVITTYDGATPLEVEQEVTEIIEEAIQSMGQLEEVRSISKPGLSIIYTEMQNSYDKVTLPQVWDELRRKVGDVQPQLPPGAGPSTVKDDFGDVFGIFLAITGDGYSYAELSDYAKFLKRELLLVTDVAKVDFWGLQTEAVYVEMSRARMAQLGISPADVAATLGNQNAVTNSGHFKVGDEYIRFDPTGMFASVKEIEDLLIRGGSSDSLVYLRDIATVRRGYVEPPLEMMRFDGKPSVGLGISTVLGGDVVRMGEGVKQRLNELRSQTPVGMELGTVSFQSDDVTISINAFMINLAEAVLIVLVVLMIFMGWRSASLIGGILLITIVSTFFFLSMWDVILQRISLGALIIALGMLVDNAIVVVEGVLIGIEKGQDRFKVAIQTVAQNSWPLLGATFVAILAFSAIGASPDSTGEYCRSLFQVILISLILSWVFAVTVTPVLATMLLKPSKSGGGDEDAYAGKFYVVYRKLLDTCLRFRWATLGATVLLFILSLYGFGFVQQSFFPDSTRAQFYVDFWLPEGTHIYDTLTSVEELDEWVRGLDGVTSTATFVGRGALRLMLTYTAEDTNSSFGHIMVTVDDYRKVDALGEMIAGHIGEFFPDAQGWYKKFVVGPGPAAKIEARFRGPDPTILRELADAAKQIMRDEGDPTNIRDDWRHKVKIMRPVYAETAARLVGVTRSDLSDALQISYDGKTMGLYREEDDLLPIITRAPNEEREEVYNVNNVQVWGSGTGRSVPMSQVVSSIETVMQDQIIRRHDRLRVIKAQCDPSVTTSEALRVRLDRKIRDLIELPEGYEFDWSGEYEDSSKAQAALAAQMPPVIIMMILIVVLLFDRLRQPLVIFLTVPLAIIGVTVGLLVTGNPFGFMALLGMLSLIGMLIKNAIVLIDQTDLNIREGMEKYEAVVMSGVSRTRPVAMAALTTMLGMIPLFQDAFFVAMAVTIVFGLGFATVLTLLIVPTLYATLFGIQSPKK